ncbi:hypothetical protein FDUTEX481_02302 [Tolypothrix sp. PCC 7601]|nr:hypothetical protein FDUTEX481_02302 [Tolypothrix sp. PCC 7601]
MLKKTLIVLTELFAPVKNAQITLIVILFLIILLFNFTLKLINLVNFGMKLKVALI